MSATQPRPQDRLRLREGAARPEDQVIQPRSIVLWTLVSLPLLGYFVWYFRALRDCARLLDDDSDPWFWMVMLFPGMLLVIPYAVAQARLVARVEIATRRPFALAAYLGLCIGGFFAPALLPLTLQPRLNRAARMSHDELRRLTL
ncbi:MAG: hypothetical protein JO153_02635 [Solirubrobacterales bacterium]|nr:hypothetical protein [Solirubrobacterales bacterium]